ATRSRSARGGAALGQGGRAAGRREGSRVGRDERRIRAVGRQAPADVVPAVRPDGGGQQAPRRVFRRALSGDCRGRRRHAVVRSRERAEPELTRPMRILALVKRVPATGGRISLTDDGRAIDTRFLGFVVSPHEECAVEEAVRLIEANGGESVVMTLGPAEAADQLRDALAIGIDRAVLLETDGSDWDPLATATALTEAVR